MLLIWKKGKDPHPQDKIQHLDFTKDPRPLYYKTPPCVFYHKNYSVVRPFSVLSKDEIGQNTKTGRFLSKAEILGVGVFSPLLNNTSQPHSFKPKSESRHNLSQSPLFFLSAEDGCFCTRETNATVGV